MANSTTRTGTEGNAQPWKLDGNVAEPSVGIGRRDSHQQIVPVFRQAAPKSYGGGGVSDRTYRGVRYDRIVGLVLRGT